MPRRSPVPRTSLAPPPMPRQMRPRQVGCELPPTGAHTRLCKVGYRGYREETTPPRTAVQPVLATPALRPLAPVVPAKPLCPTWIEVPDTKQDPAPGVPLPARSRPDHR